MSCSKCGPKGEYTEPEMPGQTGPADEPGQTVADVTDSVAPAADAADVPEAGTETLSGAAMSGNLSAPADSTAAAQAQAAGTATATAVLDKTQPRKQKTVAPTIVLLGNPNTGKSTLFNNVTGAKQAVVNAPGTTVEVMQGYWSGVNARLLDMPGTYSLIANSPDEEVVVDTLAGVPGSFTDPRQGRSVDLVLVVLDGTSITRSLYLVGQVAKTGRPCVGVITMADAEAAEGHDIDATSLSAALGIPVMKVDPRHKKEIADLEDMVKTALVTRPRVKGVQPDPTAPGYNQVAAAAAAAQADCEADPLALLENTDCECGKQDSDCGKNAIDSTAVAAAAAAERDEYTEARDVFDWVDAVEEKAKGIRADDAHMSRSDKVDRFLLHPIIGIPVFLGLMWLLFNIAANWVGPVMDFFDGLFAGTDEGAFTLANGVTAVLTGLNLQDTWLSGLLIGGLCTGLGVVASFFPLMFVIFLMISILEDSGYMARAAFLGDRLMRLIGLDGRVILPLIMGFGCNLPSLAATRTLPNAKQRLITTILVPYTSCAARMAIYLMVARIFFPNNTGTVVFSLYVLSIVMIVLGALVLRPFMNKEGSRAPLMLVLPAYQMPRVMVTLKVTWMRAWAFVKGAGKIIVTMLLVVWFLGAIPTTSGYSFADSELPMEDSAYGTVAKTLEPVFAPTGFGEWHMTGALMTGFVAKETVISSIAVSYGMDEEAAGDAEDGGEDLGSLPELVTASFEKSAGAEKAPLAAYGFLIFVLTYTPCLATVGEQARQIGGRKTAAAVAIQLVAAWVLATLVFQIGGLFV